MARVLAAISGLTPSTGSVDLYTSADYATKSFVRNPGLWLKDVTNLSCIPVYSTSVGTSFNGVLITPDILLQANHAHAGGTMYFVSDDNQVFSRDVIGGVFVGGSDIYISRLSSPLPSSIVPAKILPTSAYTGSLVNVTAGTLAGEYLPAVFTNQFATLQIGVAKSLHGTVGIYKPSSSTLQPWYRAVVSGDSGSPVFLVIDNELIALGTWWTSDFTDYSSAPEVAESMAAVNSSIAALGSSTVVTIKDLSAYPTYAP